MTNTNLVDYLLAGSELNNPIIKDINNVLSFYTNIFDQLYNEFFYFDTQNHRFVISKQNVVVPPIPHELRNFIEFEFNENNEITGLKNKMGIKVMMPRLINHSSIVIDTFNNYVKNNNPFDIPVLLDGKIEFDEHQQPHLITRILEEHMITIDDYPHLKEPLSNYQQQLQTYLDSKNEVALINDLYDYLADLSNNIDPNNQIYSCLGNYQDEQLNCYFFNQEMTIKIENDILYFEYIPYTITIDDSWLYLLDHNTKTILYPILTKLKKEVASLKYFDIDNYQAFNILQLPDNEAIVIKPKPNNVQTRLDYLNYLEEKPKAIRVLENKEYHDFDCIKLINPLKDYVVISDLVEQNLNNHHATVYLSNQPYQKYSPTYFNEKNDYYLNKYNNVMQAFDLKQNLDKQKLLLSEELAVLKQKAENYTIINNTKYSLEQAKDLVDKIDTANEALEIVLEPQKHQLFLQLINKINYNHYLKLQEPLISSDSLIQPDQFSRLIKQYHALDDLSKSHQLILEGLNYSKKELYACYQLNIDVNYYLKELKDVKSIIENEIVSEFVITTFKGQNKLKLSRINTSFNLLVRQLDYIDNNYQNLFKQDISFDLFEVKDIELYLNDVNYLIKKKYKTIPKKYQFLLDNVYINQNDINDYPSLLVLKDYLTFNQELQTCNTIIESIYEQLQLNNFSLAYDYQSLVTKIDYLYSLINFNRRYHNLMYELTIINSPLMNELVLPTSVNIDKIIEFLKAYQMRYDVVALELKIKKEINRFIKNNIHLEKTKMFNEIYYAMINFDDQTYQHLYQELFVLNDLIEKNDQLHDLFNEIKAINPQQYNQYYQLYKNDLLFNTLSNEDIIIAKQLSKFITQKQMDSQSIDNQLLETMINQIVTIDQEIKEIDDFIFIDLCMQKGIYPFNTMTVSEFEANFDCLNNHFDCLVLDQANSYDKNIIRIFAMFDRLILLETGKPVDNNIYQSYHEIIHGQDDLPLKYELTDEQIEVDNQLLYRVRYLITDEDYGITPGSLGGYISGYHNMLQDDHAYVLDQAMLLDNALIKDYAIVKDQACLRGNSLVNQYALVKDKASINDQAIITGFATISDFACINNNAQVSGNAKVGGNALIYNQVIIKDNAIVTDHATLYQNAQVFENAQIKASAVISDCAQISGYSQIEGKVYQNVKISDNAFISSNQEYFDDKIITH